MSVTFGLAMFFILWWVVFFAVLPFGVRSQDEVGEVVPGTERGAPVSPQIGRKALITTAVSGAIFGAIYGLSAAGIVDFGALLFGR